MQVQIVKIGGIPRPVYFGMNALRLWSKDTKISMGEMAALGENLPFDAAVKLAYYGVKDGYRMQAKQTKQPIKEVFSIDDFCDWLDEDEGTLEEIMNVFADSQGTAPAVENDGKKKTKAKP